MGLASPLAGAEAYHRHQRLLLYADLTGLAPEDISASQFADMESEFASNLTAQAEAELATLTFAGQQVILHERILQTLAVNAQRSKLYLSAATPYPTLAAALRDRLSELDEDAQHTEWYSIDWLVNVLLPLCASQGINGLEAIWQPGAKTKALALKDYLGASLKAAGIDEAAMAQSEEPLPLPARLDTQIRTMIKDVANHQVSTREFKELYGTSLHPGADLPKLRVFNFILPKGGALLIYYHSEAERQHVESAVHGTVRFGTTRELERLRDGLALSRTRAPDPPARNGARKK